MIFLRDCDTVYLHSSLVKHCGLQWFVPWVICRALLSSSLISSSACFHSFRLAHFTMPAQVRRPEMPLWCTTNTSVIRSLLRCRQDTFCQPWKLFSWSSPKPSFHCLIVYLKPNSKLPPSPSLSPLPCRKCTKSKPKENVKAYYLPWSNGVGAVCRHALMRSEEYRDIFLSCRLLAADFHLFAVRTWRLQRHRGGEWLKLLHCKGGMWVMCTGNCSGSMASSSFFLAQGLDTWMCPVHWFSHPQSSSPETAPESPGKCAWLGPVLPNHDTSALLYKPALWGSTGSFVHKKG